MVASAESKGLGAELPRHKRVRKLLASGWSIWEQGQNSCVKLGWEGDDVNTSYKSQHTTHTSFHTVKISIFFSFAIYSSLLYVHVSMYGSQRLT